MKNLKVINSKDDLIKAYPDCSSRSSGQVMGAKKYEIYVAAFGGHLFYDLFLQD